MNYQLKTKEININTFLLIGEMNDINIINNLTSFVKNNTKKELYHKTNVKGHFTGFDSLVGNQDFHNFLKLIQPSIYKIYKKHFLISEAWGNICELNDEVLEHNHKGVTAFCGILYLTESGTGTIFKDYNIKIDEKIGRYVLFHPLLLHNVEKNLKNKERITIAFNMNEYKGWEEQNIKVINNEI